MKISKLIDRLNWVKERHGDIEVTCTGATLPDGHGHSATPDVFETTVESLVVGEHKTLGKRVRIYL